MSSALGCILICTGRLIYGFNVSVGGYIADTQGNIWRELPKVVFSRTLDSVDLNSRVERVDPGGGTPFFPTLP